MGHIHPADVLHFCYSGQAQHYSLVDYRTHRTQGRPNSPNPLIYFQRLFNYLLALTYSNEVGSSECYGAHETVAEPEGIDLLELLVDAYNIDITHSTIGTYKREVTGTA